MPTYEYECPECGRVEEQFSSFKLAPDMKVCVGCGKRTMHRKISGGAGAVFKGDGWVKSANYEQGAREASRKDVQQ